MNGMRNSLSKNAPPLHFERAYIKITFCGKWSIFANHVTYGFQPSPEVLCMQNSHFITWITSFYGSQPSSEVFACKPETFGPKLHVSMGPRTHLWFSACKTACLASEILVSMCPSPHLWFLNAKQRILDQNYKSLRVPDLTCHFVHAIQCN